MATRDQLGDENSSNNNTNNGKRPLAAAAGDVLAWQQQQQQNHPLRSRRSQFMKFSGIRHTRVGDNFQVTELPSPSTWTQVLATHDENNDSHNGCRMYGIKS